MKKTAPTWEHAHPPPGGSLAVAADGRNCAAATPASPWPPAPLRRTPASTRRRGLPGPGPSPPKKRHRPDSTTDQRPWPPGKTANSPTSLAQRQTLMIPAEEPPTYEPLSHAFPALASPGPRRDPSQPPKTPDPVIRTDTATDDPTATGTWKLQTDQIRETSKLSRHGRRYPPPMDVVVAPQRQPTMPGPDSG